MFFTTSDGVQISYSKTGKGKPLVFLHGLGKNASVFADTISSLGKNYQSLAPDLRNHGSSGQGVFSLKKLLEDIDSLLTKHGLKQATLVGHAFGAFLALKYAETRPKKVEKLVLLNDEHEFKGSRVNNPLTFLSMPSVSLLSKLSDAFSWHANADFSRLGNAPHPHVMHEMVHASSSQTFAQGERLMLAHKIHYKNIKAPTLIVQNRSDQVLPYWCFKELGDHMKGSTVIKTDTDRCLPFVQPKTVSDLLKQFA